MIGLKENWKPSASGAAGDIYPSGLKRSKPAHTFRNPKPQKLASLRQFVALDGFRNYSLYGFPLIRPEGYMSPAALN